MLHWLFRFKVSHGLQGGCQLGLQSHLKAQLRETPLLTQVAPGKPEVTVGCWPIRDHR